ncbi:UbiA family prenyltransferase [Streptomyces sp. NPDC048604]|uniref:UbiA family prenyltransferase n=1 Tax=Streptomyces sp. NPDC048604 TaxID=3365578 RepID=UPI00371C0C9B
MHSSLPQQSVTAPGSSPESIPGPGPRPGPFTFLAWTNITLGVSAAAFTWVTSLILDRPGDPLIAAFAFLLMAASYTRDRLQPAESDGSARAAWVARNGRPLTWWMYGCTAALLPLVVLRPWCAAMLAITAVTAWLYTAPLIPWRGARLAARQIPHLKLPYVMVVWTLLGVLLPAVQQHGLVDPRAWLLALAGPLIGSVMTLLNDLRDIEADRRDGTHTLPAVLGERRTRLTAYTLAGLGAVIGLFLQPLPMLVWAAYNCVLLARYRPVPGEHPRPWGDAQGLVVLAAVLLLS